MRPPYWYCTKCKIGVKETRFPLRSGDRVPLCPRCKSIEHMDVVIGYEDTAYPADMVIYVDEEGEH